jgi:hypothetical protein
MRLFSLRFGWFALGFGYALFAGVALWWCSIRPTNRGSDQGWVVQDAGTFWETGPSWEKHLPLPPPSGRVFWVALPRAKDDMSRQLATSAANCRLYEKQNKTNIGQ